MEAASMPSKTNIKNPEDDRSKGVCVPLQGERGSLRSRREDRSISIDPQCVEPHDQSCAEEEPIR